MERERLFGRFIRERRIDKGLTQAALAMRLGIDPKTVQRWEQGGQLPRPYLLPKLEETLGPLPDAILSGSPSSPTPSEQPLFGGTVENLSAGPVNHLKKYRVQHNMSQDDLAKHIYASRLSIIRWEKGQYLPQFYHRQLLSKLFGVPIDHIFPALSQETASSPKDAMLPQKAPEPAQNSHDDDDETLSSKTSQTEKSETPPTSFDQQSDMQKPTKATNAQQQRGVLRWLQKLIR